MKTQKNSSATPKYATSGNYDWRNVPSEINGLPSITVPNQAMSMKEIMIRFSQGRPLPKAPNLFYTGDEYTPEVRAMDLVDQHELKLQNAAEIKKQVEEYQAKQKLRAESAKAARKRTEDALAYYEKHVANNGNISNDDARSKGGVADTK